MNKYAKFLLIALTLFSGLIQAQQQWKEFNVLIQKNDTTAIEQLLKNWEKENSNDPQLYVAGFNYYFRKSISSVVILGDNPKGEEVLAIYDQDTSIKEPAGFIYDDVYFNPDLLKISYDYINKGIEKFPNRLDMRFGKIHTYGETKDYAKFTDEIIKTIDLHASGKYKWTWIEGKSLPVQDATEFILGSVQGYTLTLYNTGDDKLLDNMKRIAEKVLEYYPKNVESLSNLSIVYMLNAEHDKALDVLLKAEKAAPEDYIVLSNIAHAYKIKGDKSNSIKYYELVLKHGDEDAKAYAKNQIEEMKTK